MIGISFALNRMLLSGKLATPNIQKPRQNENTMRILSGSIREPKKGAAIKNAQTLNDETKIRTKNILKSCRFNPGNCPSSLIMGSNLQTLPRYFIKNKARYHHILNPKNGWPTNKTISATVVADTVMDADALSTALFILGTKKGIDFINSLDRVEGMIVSDRGYASYSSGFHNVSGFSLLGLKNNFITK